MDAAILPPPEPPLPLMLNLLQWIVCLTERSVAVFGGRN